MQVMSGLTLVAALGSAQTLAQWSTPALAIAAAALVGPLQAAGSLLEFGALRRFHPLLSTQLAAIAHPLGAVTILGFGAPAAMIFTALHGASALLLTTALGAVSFAALLVLNPSPKVECT